MGPIETFRVSKGNDSVEFSYSSGLGDISLVGFIFKKQPYVLYPYTPEFMEGGGRLRNFFGLLTSGPDH